MNPFYQAPTGPIPFENEAILELEDSQKHLLATKDDFEKCASIQVKAKAVLAKAEKDLETVKQEVIDNSHAFKKRNEKFDETIRSGKSIVQSQSDFFEAKAEQDTLERSARVIDELVRSRTAEFQSATIALERAGHRVTNAVLRHAEANTFVVAYELEKLAPLKRIKDAIAALAIANKRANEVPTDFQAYLIRRPSALNIILDGAPERVTEQLEPTIRVLVKCDVNFGEFKAGEVHEIPISMYEGMRSCFSSSADQEQESRERTKDLPEAGGWNHQNETERLRDQQKLSHRLAREMQRVMESEESPS